MTALPVFRACLQNTNQHLSGNKMLTIKEFLLSQYDNYLIL